MTKYYDIYTQIPGISPCPQMWIVESNAPDKLMSFNSGLLHVENIVGTTVKKLSNTKVLVCRQEYFMCMVESQYEGEHMNKEKRTTKQVAKTALNAAVVISFFSLVAAAIWLVWDKREVVFNTFYTALAVFAAVLVCKEVWIITKEL